MNFARYFKLSSYCLIASGFLATAAAGTFGLLWHGLFAAALIVSWFVDTAALRKRIPTWLLNLLVLAYLPIGIFDYRYFSNSFVTVILHMVFFVAAVKLLTLSTDRDYVYLFLISFAQLLVASSLTSDGTFAFSLFAFLFYCVSTLILFEMRLSSARVLSLKAVQALVVPRTLRGTGLELFTPFPVRRMAVVTLAISLVILLLAAPLFVFLPRIALGIHRRPTGTPRMVSGFSEKVELGAIGSIKESDAVVMRVRLGEMPAGFPPNLKWRGLAFESYDGRAWHRSRSSRDRVASSGPYYKLESSIQGTQLLEQTYFLEAIPTDVVFAGHKALAISSDLGSLRRDSAGNLYSLREAQNKIRYNVVSDITPPDPDLIPLGPIRFPEEVRSHYLQVPQLDPRIATLANEVTHAIPHPFEKARRLESYLRTGYAYSLDLRGAPNSRDPLAMFLFEIRKGHCEYFATAMTVMLRQVGIPARLVNGFRAGEYNRIGDAFTVRQYDAHSWVEAWFEPYGWVEFDPTPPDPQHPRSSLARVMADLADAFGLWWWEDVVNYDARKQARVLNATRARLASLQSALRHFLMSSMDELRAVKEDLRGRAWRDRAWMILTLAGVLLALLIHIALRRNAPWTSRIMRRLHRAACRKKSGALIAGFYQEGLECLRRKGYRRAVGQTPLEFAAGLGDHPAAAPLGKLTHLYNRYRFGHPPDVIDFQEVEGLLRDLHVALASPARR